MHIDFVIYQFARNSIRRGLCNITLHAEIKGRKENKETLEIYKTYVVVICINIV
jgi:hypothetical protein